MVNKVFGVMMLFASLIWLGTTVAIAFGYRDYSPITVGIACFAAFLWLAELGIKTITNEKGEL